MSEFDPRSCPTWHCTDGIDWHHGAAHGFGVSSVFCRLRDGCMAWMLASERLALDAAVAGETAAAAGTALVACRASLCMRAAHLGGALLPFVALEARSGASSGVQTTLTAFYGAACDVTRTYARATELPEELAAMAEVVCAQLTQTLYGLVLKQENAIAAGNGGAAAKRQRQSAKALPQLIRAVESLETALLAVSPSADARTILGTFRRSTSRDFRVDTSQLQDAFTEKGNPAAASKANGKDVDEVDL